MVSERVLSGCESASFPFLGLSQEKKWGAWQCPSSQRACFTLTVALRRALPLFTSEATMAYKALLLNFLLWLLTKGPKVKAEMSIHLFAFQEGQRPHYPLSAHWSAFRGRHQKSPALEPISPREIASFCSPLFTHIQAPVHGEGQSSWGKVSFNEYRLPPCAYLQKMFCLLFSIQFPWRCCNQTCVEMRIFDL